MATLHRFIFVVSKSPSYIQTVNRRQLAAEIDHCLRCHGAAAVADADAGRQLR